MSFFSVCSLERSPKSVKCDVLCDDERPLWGPQGAIRWGTGPTQCQPEQCCFYQRFQTLLESSLPPEIQVKVSEICQFQSSNTCPIFREFLEVERVFPWPALALRRLITSWSCAVPRHGTWSFFWIPQKMNSITPNICRLYRRYFT